MVKALTVSGDCLPLEVLTVPLAAHLRTAMVVLEGVVEVVPVAEEEGGRAVEMSATLQLSSTLEKQGHLALMLRLFPIPVSMTEMVLWCSNMNSVVVSTIALLTVNGLCFGATAQPTLL